MSYRGSERWTEHGQSRGKALEAFLGSLPRTTARERKKDAYGVKRCFFFLTLRITDRKPHESGQQ